MKATRQHYNEEFKRQTVAYIQEQAKTVREIAQELNIPKSTLSQWLSLYRTFENEPLANPERIKQLEQLLREKEQELIKKDRLIADVEKELAIVKKAVHIFSRPRN